MPIHHFTHGTGWRVLTAVALSSRFSNTELIFPIRFYTVGSLTLVSTRWDVAIGIIIASMWQWGQRKKWQKEHIIHSTWCKSFNPAGNSSTKQICWSGQKNTANQIIIHRIPIIQYKPVNKIQYSAYLYLHTVPSILNSWWIFILLFSQSIHFRWDEKVIFQQ